MKNEILTIMYLIIRFIKRLLNDLIEEKIYEKYKYISYSFVFMNLYAMSGILF